MEKAGVQNEVLTFEEIKRLYPDEWILPGLSQVAGATNLSGDVLLHGKDYLELCYKGSEIASNTLTKTFTSANKATTENCSNTEGVS